MNISYIFLYIQFYIIYYLNTSYTLWKKGISFRMTDLLLSLNL